LSTPSPYVIGITGRSGSGKTSLVRSLQEHYGDKVIALHTMDNYYKESEEQVIDEQGYKNFDLPDSFEKERFCADLMKLKAGEELSIPKYDYTVEGCLEDMVIPSAPIVLVEGLFIYHYDEIFNAVDYKVIVDLPRELAYQRRLKRDVEERNYTEEVTNYRYTHHVEPAYQQFIAPFLSKMDLIVDNSISLDNGLSQLKSEIDKKIEKH